MILMFLHSDVPDPLTPTARPALPPGPALPDDPFTRTSPDDPEPALPLDPLLKYHDPALPAFHCTTAVRT
jgi:hypothetical protein